MDGIERVATFLWTFLFFKFVFHLLIVTGKVCHQSQMPLGLGTFAPPLALSRPLQKNLDPPLLYRTGLVLA